MDSYESNDKSNLDIDAFEIAEALIEAFHPQLEIARSGTKLNILMQYLAIFMD